MAENKWEVFRRQKHMPDLQTYPWYAINYETKDVVYMLTDAEAVFVRVSGKLPKSCDLYRSFGGH